MFTRNVPARPGEERKPRKRSIVSFCTAIAASAALVLLPSIPAMAAEGDSIETLTATAEAARLDANAAADALAVADAEATAAADASAAAAAAAADALVASDAAAALAAAADPADPVLDALAADALAALGVADLAAANAATAATAAADAAAAAAANADALEALAVAAEDELAAALNAPPPEGTTETEETDPSIQSKTVPNCDILTLNEDNKTSWEWCKPEPKVDIHVKNLCPTEIKVYIENLWPWAEYTVWAGGVERSIDVDRWGKASFTVTDFTSGKFEVKVYKGDHKVAYDHEWIKDDCPVISVDVKRECQTLDGNAKVDIKVRELEKWREYDITITGPNGFEEKFEVSWQEWWSEDFHLDPGTYTVTVWSEGKDHKPDIGPVVYEFTVAPCPGVVVITINPVCAVSASGSLGATLSNLVIGREYHVTVTGPGGVVTDTTFTATSNSWAVPPANLPPGTYTVTVVDTKSHADDGGWWSKDDESKKPRDWEPKEHDPLSWTATGTIASCPQVATLALTGGQPSGALLPGLLLIPFGAALLLAGGARSRKQSADES